MSFSEWKETTIGNEIELIYGKSLPKNKRIEGSYPVYGSGGVIGIHNEALVKGPGIIVGRKGTVGSLHYETRDYFPIDTVYYIKESCKYDLKFIYYFLQTQSLDKMNSHSAVPGLNREEVYKKIITLPDIQEQKVIANILSSLDEKIELNNQMNKTLEEMAQALFKRWFVDFEFPNEDGKPYKSSGGEMVDSELGMIPKGWDTKVLYELSDYINGTSFKKDDYTDIGVPIIKIAELKQGVTSATNYFNGIKDRKYYLENKDILFSWSGNPDTSIDIFLWYRGEAILNQHTFKVVPYEGISKTFMYCLLKNFKPTFTEIARNKQTTGLGHITVKDLQRLKIAYSEIVEKEYHNTVSVMIDKMIENNLLTESLIRIRDTLLPKLMSGEIRVTDLQN